MKEFILIFRMDITTKEAQPTPEQMQIYMTSWMEWINDISAQNQLAEGGNHLSSSAGKVIRPNNIMSDGPYTVNKESVAGYILIYAKSITDAVLIAKRCPILQGEGTSVEVRELEAPGKME